MEAKQRVDYVDLLRAVGIILMVMGHVKFGSAFDKYIHGYHMPLFFFISGFFFKVKEGTTIQYILKKVKTILVPYFVFASLFEILGLLRGKQQLAGFVYNNSIQVPYAGALWFLTCLFLVEVTCYCLIKYLPKYLCGAIILILSAAGSLAAVKLPFSADTAMVGIGLFYTAYLLKTNQEKIKIIFNLPLWAIAVLLAINTFLIFENGYVNMRSNKYAIIALFWINAFTAIIALWNLCKKIELSRLYSNKFIYSGLNIIRYFGVNSITFVCTNQILIRIFKKLSASFDLESIIGLFGLRILILLLTLTAGFVINEFLIRTRLKVIIGK